MSRILPFGILKIVLRVQGSIFSRRSIFEFVDVSKLLLGSNIYIQYFLFMAISRRATPPCPWASISKFVISGVSELWDRRSGIEILSISPALWGRLVFHRWLVLHRLSLLRNFDRRGPLCSIEFGGCRATISSARVPRHRTYIVIRLSSICWNGFYHSIDVLERDFSLTCK